MRAGGLALLAALLATSSCSSRPDGAVADGAIPDAAPPDAFFGVVAAPDPCSPKPCEPPVVVTTTDELVAFLEATPEWRDVGVHPSGCVPPTRDADVRGVVTVDIRTLAMPTSCGAQRCDEVATFRVRAPSVECTLDAGGSADCPVVRISGATLRFLRYRTISLPPYIHRPTIEVIQPCAATTCGEGERLCAVNGVCWYDVAPLPFSTREHCQFCLGLPWQQCACWDGEGPRPDGSACMFWLGDVGRPGTCVGGICGI